MKLSKRKVKQIEVWLKTKRKKNICPFHTDGEVCLSWRLGNKICSEAFPRTREFSSGCPCNEYSPSYVIKKARQMVKTGEV